MGDRALILLAEELDEYAEIELDYVECWVGQYYRQARGCEMPPDAVLSEAVKVVRESVFGIADCLGGTVLERRGAKRVDASLQERETDYVKGASISLRVDGLEDCTLRLRMNPCVPPRRTKVWTYVFSERGDSGPIKLRQALEWLSMAEEVCNTAIERLSEQISLRLRADRAAQQVTIYNLGTRSPAVRELIESRDEAGWKDLAARVGPDFLYDLHSLLARLATVGSAPAAPVGSAQEDEVPFVVSCVQAPDKQSGEFIKRPEAGHLGVGLYAQQRYAENQKVRFSGIAAGDGWDAWHAPAKGIALQYTTSH